MSFDTNTLYFTNNINNNLLNKETLSSLEEQVNNSKPLYVIVSYLKTYWYLIFFIVVIIILVIRYKRKQQENFEMENSMTYNELMNQESNFGRPTFNPYHKISDNVNYNHDLGTDPKFNGVYNNDVKPMDYQPIEFLGAFDNLDYDFPNTRPIINTQPSYFIPSTNSDKSNTAYKKINEENMNDVVKITYKRNNLNQY